MFLGWFADKDKSVFEGATPYVFDKMPENNVTLYAKWALKLAVSYNGHDTTVAMTSFNVTEANEDVMFVVDFEKINWDKSYIGVPMYRYEGETRIGLDTEVESIHDPPGGHTPGDGIEKDMENRLSKGENLYETENT